MNKYTFDNWKTIIIGGLGILGIGYGIAMHTKLAKVSERLDKSIEDLADRTDIDISEELIDAAVERAVAVEAKKAVEKATTEALAELKKDIHATVSVAVDKEYEGIRDTVLKKATEEAAKVDTARVRRDVERAAHAAAMSKFDDNLDDILAKFNDNLSNTSKIYSSIASAITRPTEAGKEVVFRVN